MLLLLQVLQEIGKDRPSQKAADQLVNQVVTNIKNVDSRLSEQIKYLTQVSTGEKEMFVLDKKWKTELKFIRSPSRG